jgi:ABC-type uncharacterized transport system substrate-binding protein
MLKLLSFFILAILVQFSHAEGLVTMDTAPVLNNGAKWKVAYVETGPYPNYAGTLYYLLKGLESKGWLNNTNAVNYIWGQDDSKEIWEYLSSHKDISDTLEFLPDFYYSLKTTPGKESEILSRLTNLREADIVIVMGTVAGKLLAKEDLKSKMMIFSTSNAVTSGISKELNASGRFNIWAHMSPIRYTQQLEIFSDIFKVKNLGIVYEDTPNGRAFAAIKDIETISAKKGFKVISIKLNGANNLSEQDQFFKNLLAAHKELAPKVDAFYYVVSPAPGLKLEHLYSVLLPFYERKIPVFSQLGDTEVKEGALLSIARTDFSGIGSFGAQTMIVSLKGADMSRLPQVYNDRISLAINLEIAKRIGYTPEFTTLLIADKLFSDPSILVDRR